jgi:DNA-binding response OmpR family regulator
MAKIVIVDDDVDTCKVMRRLFARWGWSSDCVTDARAAHRAVREARPAAVLLDVTMPELDGFAVLAAIRSDPEVATVPVLFHSARSDKATLERALAEGADDYIPKGTSARRIRERVGLYVHGEGAEGDAAGT